MVIAHHHQHAAVRRCAGGVGVFEHVAGAVNTRTLAVPDAEHTVVERSLGQVDLLRAPERRGGEVFIYAGLEFDMVFGKVRLGFP